MYSSVSRMKAGSVLKIKIIQMKKGKSPKRTELKRKSMKCTVLKYENKEEEDPESVNLQSIQF